MRSDNEYTKSHNAIIGGPAHREKLTFHTRKYCELKKGAADIGTQADIDAYLKRVPVPPKFETEDDSET